jgi:hypothetical protein
MAVGPFWRVCPIHFHLLHLIVIISTYAKFWLCKTFRNRMTAQVWEHLYWEWLR